MNSAMTSQVHLVVLEKVTEGTSSQLPDFFQRDLSLGQPQTPKKGNLVTLVAGVRRCGKTYRLYQEMAALLAAGVKRECMLYFNFDDERLLPAREGLLDDVITTYETLHPEALDGCFLFFDEIQEIPQWGTFLRRLVDTRKATIYVTGSSSRMLSSEMPSEFRGRSLTRELFPLSFSEYCRVQKRCSPTELAPPFSSATKARLKNALDEYLLCGGFPATLELERGDAYQVLQGYATQTVARDIVEREDLANARTAQAFARRCIASSARELSINKMAHQFKSLGLNVARATLARLAAYYEESYLVFRLREFSQALADNSRSVDKVYAVDPGLEAAFSPATTLDVGQRLETAVFVTLRRQCGYLRSGSLARLMVGEKSKRHEIDFVVGDAMLGAPLSLYQVCVNLEDEATLAREVRALELAMKRFNQDEAYLVTLGTPRDIEVESGVVHVVAAWEWLLD